jgi:DNA-binding LytR/AlgR family response regulator
MIIMNCIIVDDESNALDVLESYITKIEFLNLVGRCADAGQAAEVMQSKHVDVIFLDIDIPELSGIDFLRTLDPKPKVIFTTAHREHAIDAFELNAVDYLLKPFSMERFSDAVQRLLPENTPFSGSQLTVYHNRKHVNVDIESICYIQALGNYVKVNTTTDTLITYESIANLLDRLPTAMFVQVHKSFIVNRARIKAYTSLYVTVNGTDIPIGRTFRKKSRR